MEWRDIKVLLRVWLVVPLTALDWWVAWGRLPERVVMKYGPNGQPTSWTSREAAMKFDLVFLSCVMGLLTLIAVSVAFLQPERAGRVAWAVIGCGAFVFFLLNGVLWAYQVP